jgi:hypothetical protein
MTMDLADPIAFGAALSGILSAFLALAADVIRGAVRAYGRYYEVVESRPAKRSSLRWPLATAGRIPHPQAVVARRQQQHDPLGPQTGSAPEGSDPARLPPPGAHPG